MLYGEASRVLTELEKKTSSIKSLVFSSKLKQTKKLYALVVGALTWKPVIIKILEASEVRKTYHSCNLVLVIVYDLLFGKGLQSKTSRSHVGVLRNIQKYETRLRAELAKLKVKHKVEHDEQLLPNDVKNHVQIPRYARVNTLKTTADNVIDALKVEGYALCVFKGNTYNEYTSAILNLVGREFMKDIHIPDLLVFSPGVPLHRSTLYKDGYIVIQDKASCLPAFILNPVVGTMVIDCCAAPGNKTTHLASIVSDKGKIFAFDIDKERVATLESQVFKAGATCISTHHQDFLAVDPKDPIYRYVEYILCDPSCSGTGIVKRESHLTDDTMPSAERLSKLAAFQCKILKHSLSFPKVKRVVYSTCSIHKEENEDVVESILKQNLKTVKLVEIMPSWPNRGVGEYSKCLRAEPDKDLTNGFFVACFEKICGTESTDMETVVCSESRKTKTDDESRYRIISKHNFMEKSECGSNISETCFRIGTGKAVRKRKRKWKEKGKSSRCLRETTDSFGAVSNSATSGDYIQKRKEMLTLKLKKQRRSKKRKTKKSIL